MGFVEPVFKLGMLCVTVYVLRSKPKNMNVIMVHGWFSSPNQHWFPWLKRELKGRGYNVISPAMPNPAHPDRVQWVAELEEALEGLNPEETILIGHSLGCPTILYCLQKHHGLNFPKVILVSGFARKIPFLDRFTDRYDMRLNLAIIKDKADSWTCIHAENDPIVPFKEGKWLAKKICADFIIEKGRGHLTQYHGAVKLPSALHSISGEFNERFKQEGVLLEQVGMKLESVLGSINDYIKKNRPSLKIDPAIFLRGLILKEIAKRQRENSKDSGK